MSGQLAVLLGGGAGIGGALLLIKFLERFDYRGKHARRIR